MKMVAFDVASASDSPEQIIIKHTHVHTHTRSLSLSLSHPPFIYSTMLHSSNRPKPEEESQLSWRPVGVNIRKLLGVTSHPFGNVAPPRSSRADKCTLLFTVGGFHLPLYQRVKLHLFQVYALYRMLLWAFYGVLLRYFYWRQGGISSSCAATEMCVCGEYQIRTCCWNSEVDPVAVWNINALFVLFHVWRVCRWST